MLRLDTLFLAIASAGCCFIASSYLKRRNRENLRKLPGPKAFPIIGNLRDMPASHEWEWASREAQKYGTYWGWLKSMKWPKVLYCRWFLLCRDLRPSDTIHQLILSRRRTVGETIQFLFISSKILRHQWAVSWETPSSYVFSFSEITQDGLWLGHIFHALRHTFPWTASLHSSLLATICTTWLYCSTNGGGTSYASRYTRFPFWLRQARAKVNYWYCGLPRLKWTDSLSIKKVPRRCYLDAHLWL